MAQAHEQRLRGARSESEWQQLREINELEAARAEEDFRRFLLRRDQAVIDEVCRLPSPSSFLSLCR